MSAQVNLEDILRFKEAGGVTPAGTADAKMMAEARIAVHEGKITVNDYRKLLGLAPAPAGQPVTFFRPSDYRRQGRLRPLHLGLFALFIWGMTWGNTTQIQFALGCLVGCLLYDVHQIRVLHEAIWAAIRRAEDPEP